MRFVVPMITSKTSENFVMKFDPNDDEDKAFLEAEIEKATKPLIKKRDELLNEVKSLRKNGNDPAALERLQTQLDDANTALETTQASLKTVTKERDKAVKSHTEESAFSQQLLIDNGLNEAIVTAKVAPQFAKAVKAMLAPQAKIVADGGNRVVKIADKAVSEYVKEWSLSDEGKHYIAAANNAGSNANGSGANAGGKSMTRAAFDALPPSNQMAFSKEGGKLTDG